GQQRRTRGGYALHRQLCDDVRKAQAEARLAAEVAVFKDDPLAWLRSGPGRDSASAEGWTSAVKPFKRDQRSTGNGLVDADGRDLIPTLLDALTPFPEARLAVARALRGEVIDHGASTAGEGRG